MMLKGTPTHAVGVWSVPAVNVVSQQEIDDWAKIRAEYGFDQLATFSCPITFGPVTNDEDDTIHSGAWIGTAGIPSQRPQ